MAFCYDSGGILLTTRETGSSLITTQYFALFLRQRLLKVKRGALKWNGMASKFKSLQGFSDCGVFIGKVNKKVLQNRTNYP